VSGIQPTRHPTATAVIADRPIVARLIGPPVRTTRDYGLVGLPVERSISIAEPQLGVELVAIVERSLIAATARRCASSAGLHWPS